MKPLRAQKFAIPSLLMAFTFASSVAQGAVSVAYVTNGTDGHYDNLISTTDLINSGQSSFGSTANTVGPASDFTYAGLTDGAAATGGGAPAIATTTYYTGQPTITFNFNLNSGTGGSATGYDISVVNVFAGWRNDSNYVAQSWGFEVSTVANPTVWVPVISLSQAPVGGSLSSMATISDPDALIASGIAAVRFNVTKNNTVIREIDIIGVATIPEPSTSLLALLALTPVICRRSRRV